LNIPIVRPVIGHEEIAAVGEVLASGLIAQGERVAEFEQKFADLCGTTHAVATSNGTTALHAALLAAGIGPGDEVITTPMTFIATIPRPAFRADRIASVMSVFGASGFAFMGASTDRMAKL
jgi:perosamine synthetase